MIPETIYRAARDERLRPIDVRLLLALGRELDWVECRPVKLAWAAWLVRIDRSYARESLLRLTKAGYLVRGAKVCETGGQCYVTYRLSTPPHPVGLGPTPPAA